MSCSGCGNDLRVDAVFCSRCGRPVVAGGEAAVPAPDFGGQTCAGAASDGPAYQPVWGAPPAGTTASVAGVNLIPKQERQRRRVAGNLQALGLSWCLWGVYRLIAGMAASFALRAMALHGEWPGDDLHFLPGMLHLLMPAVALSTAAVATLSIIAGYGLLTVKPWARVLAIVLAILSLIKVPLGTALGVYTLWALAPRAAGPEYERLSQAGPRTAWNG